MGEKRSFTLVQSSFDPEGTDKKSRYIHRIPLEAARKAARVAFRNHPKDGNTVYLKLMEITRNSDNGEFFYKATQVPANRKRKFGTTTVPIEHDYEVAAVSPEEFERNVFDK